MKKIVSTFNVKISKNIVFSILEKERYDVVWLKASNNEIGAFSIEEVVKCLSKFNELSIIFESNNYLNIDEGGLDIYKYKIEDNPEIKDFISSPSSPSSLSYKTYGAENKSVVFKINTSDKLGFDIIGFA